MQTTANTLSAPSRMNSPHIYGLVMIVLLLSSSFLGIGYRYIAEIATLVLILCVNRFYVYPESFRLLVIPALLILIGVPGLFFNNTYIALKDGWYYTNMFVPVLLGYVLARKINDFNYLLRLFIICATTISAIDVTTIILNNPSLDFSMVYFRSKHVSLGINAPVISMILLSRSYGIRLIRSDLFEKAVLFICLLSLFLSFSRNNWAMLIIMLVVFAIFNKGRTAIITIVFTSLLLLAVYLLLHYLMDIWPGVDKFMLKLENSFKEIMPADYYTKMIHRRWRGFEAYKGIQSYLDGGVINLLFGHGFGKLADLQINIILAKHNFREIPVFHNAYVYVLLKTGAIGLAMYVAYILQFIFIGIASLKARHKEDVFASVTLIGLGVLLLFISITVSGIFNKMGVFSIMVLIGCLVGTLDSNKVEHYADASTPLTEGSSLSLKQRILK